MYDIYDVIIFFMLVLIIMYWWRTTEQKTFAIRTAKLYCDERDMQLLDQTLVFKKLQFKKNNGHGLKLYRVYEFDFSNNGEDRYKGEIMLSGFNFVRVILEMDKLEISEF